MAVRITARDWAESALGPIEGWPQSLRTALSIMLDCGFPTTVLWGREGLLLYNDAYARLIGARHPAALGTPITQSFPESRDAVAPLLERCFRGETVTLEKQFYQIERDGSVDDAWFRVSSVPLRDERREIVGVFNVGIETTAEVLALRHHDEAEKKLREREQRQAFLLELADRLRRLVHPADVATHGTEALGKYLGVGYVSYVEIDLERRERTFESHWGDGSLPQLSAENTGVGFADPEFAQLLAGHCISLPSPATLDAPREHDGECEAVGNPSQDLRGARAGVTVPLLKDGVLSAALSVYQHEARRWPREEIELIEAAAERICGAIERTRNETVVRENESRLSTILAHLPVGVGLFDDTGRYLTRNPALERLIGTASLAHDVAHDRDGRDATGQPLDSASYPDARALRGEIVPPDMDFGLRVDDETRWVRVGAVPLWRDGRVIGGISITQDVTERKHIEDALRASEARFRFLFESMDEGFCILEAVDAPGRPREYRYLLANPAFHQQTGVPQVVGKTLYEAFPGEPQAWADTYDDILRTGASVRFERELATRKRVLELFAFRIDDASQRRIAVLFRDISNRRRNEQRLRELASEREQLLEAERNARSEAESANELKDQFLATLSHELRTPIANVISWAGVLQKRFRGVDEQLTKGLAVISNNAMAQSKLIADLLDMSRIASGKFSLERVPVDLAEILAVTVAGEKPAADARGVDLVLDTIEQPAILLGDSTRLQQVFWNLISNAIKFTPAGGTVRVTLQRDVGWYEVRVVDTGQGIAPEFLPHVFDRFRQADAGSARRHGGLGLGLSIVTQLVGMHAGKVAAHSDGLGQGATFSVRLRASDMTLEPGASAGWSGEAVDGERSIAGIRVLVVDDQRDMLDHLKRALEDEGADVTAVDSATRALDALRAQSAERPFRVLVSDLGMPNKDGYELLRAVRGELGVPAARLAAIAVTAFARDEDRARAFAAGFQAHVAKPYPLSRLLVLIRELAPR